MKEPKKLKKLFKKVYFSDGSTVDVNKVGYSIEVTRNRKVIVK